MLKYYVNIFFCFVTFFPYGRIFSFVKLLNSHLLFFRISMVILFRCWALFVMFMYVSFSRTHNSRWSVGVGFGQFNLFFSSRAPSYVAPVKYSFFSKCCHFLSGPPSYDSMIDTMSLWEDHDLLPLPPFPLPSIFQKTPVLQLPLSELAPARDCHSDPAHFPSHFLMTPR